MILSTAKAKGRRKVRRKGGGRKGGEGNIKECKEEMEERREGKARGRERGKRRKMRKLKTRTISRKPLGCRELFWRLDGPRELASTGTCLSLPLSFNASAWLLSHLLFLFLWSWGSTPVSLSLVAMDTEKGKG